jgi:hypothetical protein
MADQAPPPRTRSPDPGVPPPSSASTPESRVHSKAKRRAARRAQVRRWARAVLGWVIAAGLAALWSIFVRPPDVGGVVVYVIVNVYVASALIGIVVASWPTRPTEVAPAPTPVPAVEAQAVPAMAGEREPKAPGVVPPMVEPPAEPVATPAPTPADSYWDKTRARRVAAPRPGPNDRRRRGHRRRHRQR